VIELRGDLLSVQAHDAPWVAVLRELERLTGITITVTGTFTGTLSREFTALPLEQGLRRLFRDVNPVVLSASGATGKGSAVIHVWLFPQEEHGVGQLEAPGAREQSAEGLPETASETLTEDTVTGGEQTARRLQALHAFAQQGNVQALQQVLFDPDLFIQATAFALFAERDHQGAVAALLGVTQSEQPERRWQALEVLRGSDQVDERTVLTALHTALADEDATVKAYAIHALADRGGAEALAYLHQALRDPDVAIRRLVLESVIQLDDALPLVQEAVEDDDEALRSMALARLGRANADTQ
jgi:HEAT repeat protein